MAQNPAAFTAKDEHLRPDEVYTKARLLMPMSLGHFHYLRCKSGNVPLFQPDDHNPGALLAPLRPCCHAPEIQVLTSGHALLSVSRSCRRARLPAGPPRTIRLASLLADPRMCAHT